MSGSEAQFTGSVPENYNTYLGPFFFEPYAAHFVGKLTLPAGCRVLELACGTGILTRRLLSSLPADGSLLATDLNEAMIAYARGKVGPDPRLEWRVSDAASLPFADASFDRVACQYGVMFFPDKRAALQEARRVLKAGGEIALNTWDSLEANDSARIMHQRMLEMFPADPPKFLLTPFGYFDRKTIRSDLEASGFRDVQMEEVALDSSTPTARHAALGMVQGSPLFGALQERGVTDPAPIVEKVAKALASALGEEPMRTRLKAIWVSGKK